MSFIQVIPGQRLVDAHPQQKEVFEDKTRFKIVCCGRRWGKSVLMLGISLDIALTEKNKLLWIVLPTREMAEEIYWDTMLSVLEQKGYVEGEDYQKWNNKLKIKFLYTSSVIQLKSADKPDRLKGSGIYFYGVDEVCYMKDIQKIWNESVVPSLLPNGKAVITSTPKGYNYFYDLWAKGRNSAHTYIKSWQFPTYGENAVNNPTIPDLADKIAIDKELMSPDLFEQEYLAQFNIFANQACPYFKREIHTCNTKVFHDEELLIGCDFNYTTMSWVIFQYVDRSKVIKSDWGQEYLSKNPNIKFQNKVFVIHSELKKAKNTTEMQCDDLKTLLNEDNLNWYKSNNEYHRIRFYGDATGTHASSNITKDIDSGKINTCWNTIGKMFPLSNKYYYRTNPRHYNRINAFNKAHKNELGEIGFLINCYQAPNTIKEIEQLSWLTSGDYKLDKSEEKNGIGHLTDGISYAVHYLTTIPKYNGFKFI